MHLPIYFFIYFMFYVESTLSACTTNPMTLEMTTSVIAGANNQVCQCNTGVRLNATAIELLTFLNSFNYTNLSLNSDSDECCIRCNIDPLCDYAFELIYSNGISNCAYYKWNLPPGLTSIDLAKQVKQGQWYQAKRFSIQSGKLLFSNKFLRLI